MIIVMIFSLAFDNLNAHFDSLIFIDVDFFNFFDVNAVDLSRHNLKRDESNYYNKDENLRPYICFIQFQCW